MTWRSRNPQAGASWPRAALLLCGRRGVDASRVRVCVLSELQTHVMTPAAVYLGFQTHMQMMLICGKASVDNAVPMPTVMDAKAVKEIFCLTGTGGFLCCGSCQNVSSASDIPRLVHYTCDDPSKFVKHTHTSFIRLCDVVERGAAEMGRKIDVTNLQKFCGISYHKGAFPFDRYTRELSDITKLMYWDHMHTLSASGGIGQFTLNAAAVKLARSGFNMQKLDELIQMVKLPKCWGTIHPRFFRDRTDIPKIGHDSEGHVKAFSGEVLAATRLLSLTYRILLNAKVFPLVTDAMEYYTLLDTMRQVYDLFLIGDRLVQHTDLLQALLLKHHKLYCKLIPQCQKPKLHLALHLAECVKEHGYNVSAAAGERSIAQPKQAGSRAFRGFHKTLTGEAWHKTLKKLLIPAFGQPQYLPQKRRSTTIANAHESTSAVSMQGLLSVGDLVFWNVVGFHVGFIISIVQLDKCGTIIANVHPLVKEAEAVWRRIPTSVTLSVEISCLRALTYSVDAHGLCSILFPPV